MDIVEFFLNKDVKYIFDASSRIDWACLGKKHTLLEIIIESMT